MKQTVGMLMGIYNEAARIADCLDYHMQYMDEIVIVCQESDDGTEKVLNDYLITKDYRAVDDAKNENAELYYCEGKARVIVLHYPKMGSSEATLQFGADALTTDWIIYIDADEKFPEEFLKQMKDIVSIAQVDGFWFERDNWFEVPVFNEAVPIEPKSLKIKHPTRDRQFRLTRKSKTWFPPQIHVRARVRGPLGNGDEEKTQTLNYTMYHFKSLEEQWTDNHEYLHDTRLVKAMEMTKHGELIEFPVHDSPTVSGHLTVATIPDQIPFEIKRVFWIFDSKGERGHHANKLSNEVLVVLQGGVTVLLDTGSNKSEFNLIANNKGLFIKKHTWLVMKDFLPETIILVFADTEYSPEDRIGDYDKFLEMRDIKP